MRAAVVEREVGDAARDELGGQEIGAPRLEDRRAAGAVQKDRGAVRARFGSYSRPASGDAVGRFEADEPAERLGTICADRAAVPSPHVLARQVRAAEPVDRDR